MWHLAAGAEGQPPPRVSAGRSTDPLVARLESEIVPSLPLPGAQHRHDTVLCLPRGAALPPTALLAEREGTLWQKHLMELQQNRYKCSGRNALASPAQTCQGSCYRVSNTE